MSIAVFVHAVERTASLTRLAGCRLRCGPSRFWTEFTGPPSRPSIGPAPSVQARAPSGRPGASTCPREACPRLPVAWKCQRFCMALLPNWRNVKISEAVTFSPHHGQRRHSSFPARANLGRALACLYELAAVRALRTPPPPRGDSSPHPGSPAQARSHVTQTCQRKLASDTRRAPRVAC